MHRHAEWIDAPLLMKRPLSSRHHGLFLALLHVITTFSQATSHYVLKSIACQTLSGRRCPYCVGNRLGSALLLRSALSLHTSQL